jgi:NifB/MoaA-like Fe-S oxidoreductase
MIVVTGTLAEPVLRPVVERINHVPGMQAELHVVRNEFFGEQVTVAGLLTAGDVVDQIGPLGSADLVVLPRVMFDYAGERTIDDKSPDWIAEQLGSPIDMARHPQELVQLVRSLVKQVDAAPVLAAA